MALAPSGGAAIERRLGEVTGAPRQATSATRTPATARRSSTRSSGWARWRRDRRRRRGKLQQRLVIGRLPEQRSARRLLRHPARLRARRASCVLSPPIVGSPNLPLALAVCAARLRAAEHGRSARMAKARQHRIRLGPARRARPARRQRRSRPRPRSGDSARRRRAGLRASGPVRRAAADQPRAARRQGARRSAAQPGRAHRRRRHRSRSSRCWCRPTSSARASRSRCACTPRRCARSGGSAPKKRRPRPASKMVFPLVFCIFPGDLGRDARSGRHQVRPGPAARWRSNDDDTDDSLIARRHPTPRRRRRRRRRSRRPASSADQVEQLLVKTLYTGEATGLGGRRSDAAAVRDARAARSSTLRAERLIEVRGAAGSGTAGYRYALTDAGRDRARQYLDVNQYVGPAPVPLAALRRRDDARCTAARGYIDRERLRQGLLASDHRRRHARAARARPSTRARRSSSTARPATARP